jgi:hypothetical protein
MRSGIMATIAHTRRHSPQQPGTSSGHALRQYARLYLRRGLHPVPAWGTTGTGACQCGREDCPRPGKHPRSVHIGPGPRDYSWRPLAATSETQLTRFANGSTYAAGNLMLAIPPGLLVVDIDYDDGGRGALTRLNAAYGPLPATLKHRTPHGQHRIYSTPEGWEGRAWCGKAPGNPLPPGIDLRVPGQILMAPPSVVPNGAGLATYGPTTVSKVAALPATYLAAWAAPPLQPRRPVKPVPASHADRAAAYARAAIDGILGDLAQAPPGGRNAVIYTAALKLGSVLGGAHAAGILTEWEDADAADALLQACDTNGYVHDKGTARARSAIKSGLRTGLRDPRPLPEALASPAEGARA